MQEFINFLGFMNSQLRTREIPRFEAMLMSANFSSLVGEFIAASLPKYCASIVKNRYHNGHPDLLPARVNTQKMLLSTLRRALKSKGLAIFAGGKGTTRKTPGSWYSCST